MLRAFLLAYPAGHSASPAMHQAAFAACGIQARYRACNVPPARLPAVVARLRASDATIGANLSVPHKRAVLPLADRVAAAAAAIGAANVLRRDGRALVADNSDADGFLRSLVEAGVEVQGRVAAVLGAGGAARAVVYALLRAQVAEVRIVNRTAATAEALAADARQAGWGAAEVRSVAASELAGCDLFVNATSLGMAGYGSDRTPVPERTFADAAGSDPVALDLVYRPRRTRFLQEAAAAGLRTVDGTGMLLHQGAAAFEAWTGRAAPLAVMRDVLERELADAGS